ncbi:ribosomal-processing cysteine protease Prp [Oceanivirga miroungae]|uniref:Ribosomal processing cysteine protease Prp n=1 Tax=Oceanivirga miroungae TaxID=1130046 RepID=A0A6I8M8S0_9FUSO|nr:ribosomal-processing cysteine protease Prp [Oceanivirga miroungae]VWL85927.1 hypothetical protein OMES3154_01215 [Oceanivirga miroungae]
MINVLFKRNKEHILYFEIKGHSNLSFYGTDIVCAAVSSISVMTINGILEYLKYDLPYKQDDGYIEFSVEDNRDEKVQTLLHSMYLYLDELSRQYPKNLKLKVMEV